VSALAEQFVIEARELIRQATDDLIRLERDGGSPDRIDRVFRAFHTLKGAAGVVELPALSLMLHAAEDLLAEVRKGTLEPDAPVIDAALACIDQVAGWVDDFETAGALPSRSAADGRAMGERLRSFLPGVGGQRSNPLASAPVSNGGGGTVPEWVVRLIAAEGDAMTSRIPAQFSEVTAISYEPLAGCFYTGDDPLQLLRQVPDLLALHVESREAVLPIAEIDPYACNLRALAISAGDREVIARIFQLVPDQVQIVAVPPAALPPAVSQTTSADEVLVRRVIEAQCALLRLPNRTGDFAGWVGAAARVAINALRYSQQTHLAEAVAGASARALAEQDGAHLLSALEEALAEFTRPAPVTVEADRPDVTSATSSERPAERVIRISETKIEALVNLAGELLVARNALAYSSKQAELEFGRSEVVTLIQRDRDAIDRLVTELNGAVLQLRMVPAVQLFGSFPRLIRDVARQLAKNVQLVTRGETTEVDKAIIDRLFEPMVHLVRNALDHGIETPEQRRAVGKSEAAKISIDASRLGDRLVIEVSDDGRGIDPAVVRRKASESQLLPLRDLAALTDEAVIDLVFAAGFSTASAISDISGRGIGMDVVRTAMEQIGGRVSLESKLGFGTTVRLDLPMAIAMSRIMVVEASGQMFGIAMEAVSETVRVAPDRVSTIKNNDGFVLRDRVVPIISLAEIMKLPRRERDLKAARLLVVVEAAGRIAAFEIDAIRDRLDVVLKPMAGLLAGARGYAGTTLLGNGQVLLVLDVKELMP
jgi:two-component system chemotaxis sensor kinase CheA